MKSEHPVLLLCELLGVSRSGYYRRKMAPVSLRQREDVVLAAQIVQAHRASRNNYGAPRVVEELRARGVRTSKRRCARLMRTAGVRGRKRPRRRPRTTDSRHARAVPGNHLAARPTPAGANQT